MQPHLLRYVCWHRPELLKWVALEPAAHSIWASRAHTSASSRYPTLNLLIFLSGEHSYQVFSFPCFINNTIKFSHVLINYLYPCNVSCLRMLIDCFPEALAFHLLTGNHMLGIWSLCGSCVSPVFSPVLCLLFACFACADTDVRTNSHISLCPPLLVLWGLGCVKGGFPGRFYVNILLETLTVFLSI